MSAYFIIIGLLVTWMPCAWAQEPTPAPATTPMPAVIVMPWIEIAMDKDVISQNREVLSDARRQLAQTLVGVGEDLATFAARNNYNFTVQQQARARQFLVGNWLNAGAWGGLSSTVVLHPIIATIADRVVISLEVATLNDQLLIAAGRRVSAADMLQTKTRVAALNQALPGSLINIWQTLQPAAHMLAPPTDAVKLGFSLGKNSNRWFEGPEQVLTMILAQEVARSRRVVRFLGLNDVEFVRRALNQQAELQRASRQLVTIWDIKRSRKMPLQTQLTMRTSEAVLGSAIQSVGPIGMNIPADLQWTMPEAVTTFLQQTAQTLQVSDAPQVAKIDRAWVYLDRGRAWGLKMNDRLVSRVGTDLVKGHVVGFYGSKLNIQSPRGYPVAEGAIVYVRKGQRETTIGQTFEFDPTTYPTPWPPEPKR